MNGSDFECAPPVASEAEFAAVVEWLPHLIEDPLASPVYNIDDRPPATSRGIYLFSEGDRHMYVGRTGCRQRLTSDPPPAVEN